ncbi:MAG: pyridoxal-5-phosphate-dependent protein subunit beta, partial [Gammaproteobacteria bacterium]|nr:pyridoxal-5-phosphate-dependent protein subunit beta [Gammaproteobacteria bacterium]
MSLVPPINQAVLDKSKARARKRGIVLPTFAQMKDPGLVPDRIAKRLENVGLWDVDPANLFRITWKNEPVEHGGGFNDGNWIEFPQVITGVDATIVGIVGNWFPTGAHKVGAAYGCLVPRLVTGN